MIGPGGGGVLSEWLDPVSGAVLALLWIVAVTNAFNFIDGSDGLAATVGALCAAMFLASSLLSGQAAEGLLFSCLMGALLAFLACNFPPARMFMGDGGSLVVGYAFAWGSLRLTYFDAGFRLESPWYAVFTPLVVLAIPLYDLVTVITLRLLDREAPCAATVSTSCIASRAAASDHAACSCWSARRRWRPASAAS